MSNAQIVQKSARSITVSVEIPISSDFLECEEKIQDALNEVGCLATQACLEEFDTDGSPIIMGHTKFTAKSTKVEKKYETPYGVINIPRYAYQTSAGGEVFIPLEQNARIIVGSTPRFARSVAFKYADANAGKVQRDLQENHGRKVSRCYIQDVSQAVADHMEDKAHRWDYTQSDPPPHEVAAIAISLDGTCLFFSKEGYREAMVGTIAFYDAEGNRLHTTYIAAAPEHGKATFLSRMEKEIGKVKANYPHARFVGISDGATDYRVWLEKFTTTQILDFWHLSEYLNAVAPALFPRSSEERKEWVEETLHHLKHNHGAARNIHAELGEVIEDTQRVERMNQENLEKLRQAHRYLGNNLDRTNYASYRKSHLPIGSGVMEAGCKTVVKERMCGSGMKWKQRGADAVLTLRAMMLSENRWNEFWRKVSQYGLSKL